MSSKMEINFRNKNNGNSLKSNGRHETVKPENVIVESIHRAYESLSRREKMVADIILKAPGELSVYPASELASLAGVSNSTITRFVQRTGFGSYDEMRIAARDARSWGSPLFQAEHFTTVSGAAEQDLISSFSNTEADIINRSLAGFSLKELEEITDALIEARNLVFMGFRNSHFLAGYARAQFLHFRARTRLVPGRGETVAQSTSDLGPDDLVVVIGLRRIIGGLRRYMEALSNRNVPILLITDPSARVVPAYARWTITCPVETAHVFDSYSGVQAILRLLAYQSFNKLGSKAREHMEKIEAQHEEMGEFE